MLDGAEGSGSDQSLQGIMTGVNDPSYSWFSVDNVGRATQVCPSSGWSKGEDIGIMKLQLHYTQFANGKRRQPYTGYFLVLRNPGNGVSVYCEPICIYIVTSCLRGLVQTLMSGLPLKRKRMRAKPSQKIESQKC